MTAMLPGAFAKASIETRFEDTLVSAHRVASARRTSSRLCSAAMSDRAPEVRLRLDRLTALRGGQGPHRRRRGEPLLHLPRRRPLPLCWPPEAREPLLSPYPRPRKRGIKVHNTKTLSENRQVEQHVGTGQLNQCQPVLCLLGPASAQAATLG